MGGGYEIKLTRQVSTEQLCNHNELINADFWQGRLVNQRGQTVYNNYGYFIDMWVMGDGVTCILEEDGLRISNHSDYYNGIWYLTEKPLQAGKDYTISLNILDNTNVFTLFVQHCGGEYYNDVNEGVIGTGVYSKSFTHATSPYITKIAISLAPQSEIKLQAAMLEYGDISTLHNWHGDYAIELLKCQRYLYALPRLSTFFVETSNTGKQARIVVTTPVDMRVAPSIENLDLTKWGLRIDGVVYSLDNLSVERKAGNETILLCNGVFPSNQAGSCYLLDAVFLSAEL